VTPSTDERASHDLDDALWRPWIDRVADALGVDGAGVDVGLIHSLTRVVAHEFQRPMAPVAAYILGLAVGTHGRPADELKDAIVAVVRESVSR